MTQTYNDMIKDHIANNAHRKNLFIVSGKKIGKGPNFYVKIAITIDDEFVDITHTFCDVMGTKLVKNCSTKYHTQGTTIQHSVVKDFMTTLGYKNLRDLPCVDFIHRFNA